MSDILYDHIVLEEKWQKIWENLDLFQQSEKSSSKTLNDPIFLLFAFAYPSGSGLHVGHVESKTALDILARYYRMLGRDVFFPVGWDAFGLPAENYAIKTGVHPAETTVSAINTFRRQIKRLGISYDWANEIATSHPGYYKWTQWLFLQLYSKDLAYKKPGMVNWCPSCQTVLANEQVVEGHCERCDTEVIQKEMEQWFFKITQYQDELISGLDQVDWPEPTKQQQLHWIGKKSGINITYKIVDENEKDTGETITCFTTRPDTNFGATFVVIAPEHNFSQMLSKNENQKITDEHVVKIKEYISSSQKKTELERQTDGKKKTGVFTGFYAVNQLTNTRMPIWISDFVLSGFGTGAVVGVPGHDLRDFQFANAKNLPVIRVVVGSDNDDSDITQEKQVQEAEGYMVNSGFLDGLEIMEAKEKMMDYLEQNGWGKRVTTYRLRDWLISRQRYWGAPIPIVYDPEGKPHPVKEEHLPWELPTDVDFKPTGESPLTSSQEFIERTEKLYGKGWRPEFDTMDTFVDSSWYFFRYISARNEQVFAEKEQIEKWLPVDFYMIGPEHIVLHLLYSRFFTKFLRDEGYCNFDEPFMKMRHQGMILGPDGKKMSKSKGNVINPDDIIAKFGADTLRMYEMFMGPIEADKPWNTRSVIGMYKFLQRVSRLVSQEIEQIVNKKSSTQSLDLERKIHQTIYKVTQDIPQLKFNTAIAAMMEFVNSWQATERGSLGIESTISFIKLLAPFAPFLADDLYHLADTSMNETDSIHLSSWPSCNETLMQDEKVTIAVQVNGKVRGTFSISRTEIEHEQAVINQAKSLESVAHWISSGIVKSIYVRGKIVSFVV